MGLAIKFDLKQALEDRKGIEKTRGS